MRKRERNHRSSSFSGLPWSGRGSSPATGAAPQPLLQEQACLSLISNAVKESHRQSFSHRLLMAVLQDRKPVLSPPSAPFPRPRNVQAPHSFGLQPCSQTGWERYTHRTRTTPARTPAEATGWRCRRTRRGSRRAASVSGSVSRQWSASAVLPQPLMCMPARCVRRRPLTIAPSWPPNDDRDPAFGAICTAVNQNARTRALAAACGLFWRFRRDGSASDPRGLQGALPDARRRASRCPRQDALITRSSASVFSISARFCSSSAMAASVRAIT